MMTAPIKDVFPHWVFDCSPIPDPFGYGQKAVDFIRAQIHPKTGKPFQLDSWMERIVRGIYGPCHPDGRRIVRNVVIMLPRGGRKTTLGAALALLHTLHKDFRVPGGQVILAAYDKAQARIAYDEAHGLALMKPRVMKAIKVRSYRNEIEHRDSRSVMKAVSSDAAAQNGKTPSFVLFDEVHAWKKRELYDVLRTGLGKTAGTLNVVISQAGRGQENLAHEIFDYARQVALGDIIDPGTLPILFETVPGADWEDEAVWHRVNPGLALGYPDLDSLRQEAREAKNRPAMREKFRNDHLNIWLSHSLSSFVPMEIYDQGAAPIDRAALKGEPCWIGVDMSSTTDLTCVLACFKDGDAYTVLPTFFCPGDNLDKRGRKDGVDYEEWAKKGYIVATPGNVIDPEAVEEHIRDLCREFDVQEIAFDQAYAAAVMSPLVESGFPVITMRQGWFTQSPALNILEAAILSGNFQHGGNPVLRWHFDNVAIHTDSAGNRTGHKGKSRDRIDGFYAAWMAVARAAAGESSTSIYATSRPGGFLSLGSM